MGKDFNSKQILNQKDRLVYWNAKNLFRVGYIKYKAQSPIVQYNHQYQTEKNIAVAVIKGAKKYGNE